MVNKRDIPLATFFLVLSLFPLAFIYNMVADIGKFFLFFLYYEVFASMLKAAIKRYFPIDD